jgi:hypothetical protein
MHYSREAIAVAILVGLGCGKHFPASGGTHGTEVGVSIYYDPSTSTDRKFMRVQFKLSPEELASIGALIPDVSRAEPQKPCKHAVPPFGIELYRPGATTSFARGDFSHAPGELVLDFDDGEHGRLRGQQAFHDALVAVIKQRGYWKK